MNYRRNESRMGEGIDYRPSILNPNLAINNLFAPSARSAFPGMESAIIIQQKKIPDVSFWQGEINWDLMREKTDTVIIRAGQNVWEDEQFERNWAEAKARGMKRAPYWFYDDRESPGAQAEKFDELLFDDPPEMEVIIDWEKVFGGSFRGLPNVVSMMERMEAFGYLTAMYTGYPWFRGNSNAIANASQYAYLKSRPLHLAWYTENAANVLIPFPWLELWMWQFGTPAEGLAYGAKSKEIDMSFANMTNEQFYLRYGVIDPLPPGPEEPMATYELTVLTAGLNIRAGAGVEYAITVPGGLRQGDKVFSNERLPAIDGIMWYRINSIWRGGLNVPTTGNGWASAGATGGLMRLDKTSEPVPEPPTQPPLPELHIDIMDNVVTVWGPTFQTVIVELTPK